MTLVLTGFDPFPGVPVNPSQQIVETIAMQNPAIITEILPTAFAPAEKRIRSLIQKHAPDVVLSLGVAARRDAINLERFALNINDAEQPDNDGVQHDGKPIVANGPAAYTSTLPLAALHKAIQARRVPVKYSNHAGAYVCNHVFYVARHEVERLRLATRCGFIHVPMPNDGLSLADMIDTIQVCIQQLMEGR